jgi:hypothetical protein
MRRFDLFFDNQRVFLLVLLLVFFISGYQNLVFPKEKLFVHKYHFYDGEPLPKKEVAEIRSQEDYYVITHVNGKTLEYGARSFRQYLKSRKIQYRVNPIKSCWHLFLKPGEHILRIQAESSKRGTGMGPGTIYSTIKYHVSGSWDIKVKLEAGKLYKVWNCPPDNRKMVKKGSLLILNLRPGVKWKKEVLATGEKLVTK